MSAQDKDVPMPSVAAPASSSGSAPTPPPKTKENQEIHEKYRKLKRRFFELEEKHKETSTELQRSGERNVKMREERNILLDRIIELESHPGIAAAAGATSPTGSTGAFPRSLITSSARNEFAQNLRDAAAEEDADADADPEIDPALTMDAPAEPEDASSSVHNGSNTDAATDSVDSQLAPTADTPVMVSSTGTRLRIRPVGGEDPSADPVSPPASSHPPIDPPAPNARSISPDSGGMPVDDDNDDSGEYSPAPKGTKRNRDSADYNGDPLADVSPEPKAPRRSSRRSGGGAAAAPTATPTSASRTRVIQAAKSTRTKAAAPAASPSPAGEDGASQASPKPELHADIAVTNGHNPDPAAGLSSAGARPPPNNLAFNPYYPYLAPSGPMAPNAPYPYANPYAYYMPPPMPGGPMPYMPPPNFAPPRPQPEPPRTAKPKRLKAHTVTSKSYSIPMVPRDKKGKPMLPLNVGIMTVINLGDVCMREHFHTERYIFPVGYEVTRRYLSTVDQTAEVVYHCTILDGGDGPKFQIIPSDVPERPVIAGTATGAWSTIVKQANALRQRQHSNSVSGPDFFGLGQNTIKHLIQELPNADRLRDYVWQHFVEGGPLGGRHAAVIPALPEEYDAAMPVGPYYPPRQAIQRDQDEEQAPRHSHYPPHILAQAQAAPKRAPPPPPQQQQQPEYNNGGRQVMPPGAGASSSNYYLPHTQQQSSDGSPPPGGPGGYPPGPSNGGATYASGPSYAQSNGNNGNSFASIMNAFPTQDGGPESGGGGGEAS